MVVQSPPSLPAGVGAKARCIPGTERARVDEPSASVSPSGQCYSSGLRPFRNAEAWARVAFKPCCTRTGMFVGASGSARIVRGVTYSSAATTS